MLTEVPFYVNGHKIFFISCHINRTANDGHCVVTCINMKINSPEEHFSNGFNSRSSSLTHLQDQIQSTKENCTSASVDVFYN